MKINVLCVDRALNPEEYELISNEIHQVIMIETHLLDHIKGKTCYLSHHISSKIAKVGEIATCSKSLHISRVLKTRSGRGGPMRRGRAIRHRGRAIRRRRRQGGARR